jgi:hypothetical protein
MSVKTKLARQAVKSTAKHTATGAAARFARRPLRSITLLTVGVVIGGLVGWLIGRSAGGEDRFDPIARQAPAPPSVATPGNSTEPRSETGATS